MHIYGTTTHMRYLARSHVLAQILYVGVRLIINLTTVLNPQCFVLTNMRLITKVYTSLIG